MRTLSKGFTLIELLVVIAILAVLAVVVVLTLNPAGLLQESRDSSRLSAMASISTAINLVTADISSANALGQSNILYISVPDPSISGAATSSCSSLGLPSLPTPWAYQCSSPQNYRKTDGSGWIPINFAAATFGTPLSLLPVDPVNATSAGLYYAYATNGQQYEVTSLFESAKYKLQYANSPIDSDYPEVDAGGSNLSLSPLYNPAGLVGYWALNEGTGTTASDLSGSGNNGSWSGTVPYYTGGKVGTYAGSFNGTNDYVTSTLPSILETSGTWSMSLWSYIASSPAGDPGFFGMGASSNYTFLMIPPGACLYWTACVGSSSIPVDFGQWDMWTITRNGTIFSVFKNGTLVSVGTTVATTTSMSLAIGAQGTVSGAGQWFNGSIDDVRAYSRTLSVAEIKALYNAER